MDAPDLAQEPVLSDHQGERLRAVYAPPIRLVQLDQTLT